MIGKRSPTTWRPSGQIRAIAIGIIRRGPQILVLEGQDPTKADLFYRPLGGGIEPGERGSEAVVREFAEEMEGVEVVEPRLLGTLENIFSFAGSPGHEIALVFETRFRDSGLYGVDRFTCHEENGEPFAGLWLDLERARNGSVALYPDGLIDLLDAVP
jgi:ADP-ribose pyrophosphatase YjhB (NUDIX family)